MLLLIQIRNLLNLIKCFVFYACGSKTQFFPKSWSEGISEFFSISINLNVHCLHHDPNQVIKFIRTV